MSLSTSSSRQIYFKIVLAIVLGMAASMAIIRLVTYLNDASSDTFLGRVQQARAALPKIVQEPDDLVMFFGSSMVQAGFSPRKFDREIAEQGGKTKSFNFGFGGLNPFFQDYLSRRIEDEFVANDRRLKLALIEFNPFQTTITRRDGAREIEDSFITLLGSNKELWDITLDNPKRGIRLFNIRYFRDGVSAEMITSFFGRGFRPPRRRTELVEDEAILEERERLGALLTERFEKDYPDFVDSDWSYDWQGAGTILEERSEGTLALFHEYFASLQTDYEMDNDRIFRIESADILELNFDPELVEAFIRIVKNFQQFSDHVEVVLLPKNTQWIQNTPEAIERMRLVVRQIERETGVVIKDYQEVEQITPAMFRDTTHLARYLGDIPFTELLVDEYVELLKQ